MKVWRAFLFWILTAVLLPTITNAQSLFCERYFTAGVNYMAHSATRSKQQAFDQWMPETIIFNREDIDKFESLPGKKSIIYKRETTITNLGTVWTQEFQLLPNKKLITSHPQGKEVSAKYNCDKGAEEITSIKAQKLSTAEEEKGCFDGNANSRSRLNY